MGLFIYGCMGDFQFNILLDLAEKANESELSQIFLRVQLSSREASEAHSECLM